MLVSSFVHMPVWFLHHAAGLMISNSLEGYLVTYKIGRDSRDCKILLLNSSFLFLALNDVNPL